MKYQDYQTEDFIRDPFFVRWVKENDQEARYFWERFLETYPEKRTQILRAKDLVASVKYLHQHSMPEKQDQKILESLILENRKYRNPSKKSWQVVLKWAAMFILMGFTAFWFSRNLTPDDQIASPSPRLEMVTRSVPNGQKVTIRLPDQTLVKLNSGSEISYEEDFDQGRQITLTGEAFFEVVPDSTQPFIIQSGELRTMVLGTSFNVKAYPQEKEVQVAVVSGKVQVSCSDSLETLLLPDQVATFHREKKSISTEVRNISNLIAWRDGILIFEREGIQTVETKLEKWFGVEILLEGSFDSFGNYSGKYHNESLESVLEGITYASGLQYTLENDRVTLKMKLPM